MPDHHREHHHSYLWHGGVRLLSSLFGEDDNLDDTTGHAIATNSTTTAATMMLHDMVVKDSSSSLPPESAPWSTRKTILFAEAIGVTAIVIPLVFCFLYHRAAKLGHLPTTMSISFSSARRNSGATTTNAAASGVVDVSEIIQPEQNNNPRPPTLFQRLLSLPSKLLSILLYPIRVIDAGVHSWSTTNEDITFLRSVMERLEEERVAQLEDVQERGERLKLAFSNGDVVWKIAEEHFIPPPTALYSMSSTPPDMIVECMDGMEHDTTAPPSSFAANGYKEGLAEECEEVEGLESKEEKLSEEEQNQLDAKNGNDATAMNTVNDSAIDAIHATAAIDEKEEGSDKNEEGGGIDREHNNNEEEEGNEQCQYLSPLMMDETNNEKDRSSSPLMIDEGDDFVGGYTSSPLPPPRSSSPLDAGETPAFLYLPHRKSRSRTNTNETNSSNMPSLAPSSSSSSNQLTGSQSSESMASSSNTNNSTKMDNSSDNNNNNATSPEEEEDLKSIPNNCAICLSEYVSGDTIVTSCNSMCPHAFHQECIVEWLVKMQVGAPCPCCRRTFVELSPSRPTAAGGGDGSNNNSVVRRTTSPEEEERRREELRRTIRLGIRRGRAFDFSVISLR